MPVHTEGKKIVETATGKVVGTSTSTEKAKAASRIRNMAVAAKEGDAKAKAGMEKLDAKHKHFSKAMRKAHRDWRDQEENPYNRHR